MMISFFIGSFRRISIYRADTGSSVLLGDDEASPWRHGGPFGSACRRVRSIWIEGLRKGRVAIFEPGRDGIVRGRPDRSRLSTRNERVAQADTIAASGGTMQNEIIINAELGETGSRYWKTSSSPSCTSNASATRASSATS